MICEANLLSVIGSPSVGSSEESPCLPDELTGARVLDVVESSDNVLTNFFRTLGGAENDVGTDVSAPPPPPPPNTIKVGAAGVA